MTKEEWEVSRSAPDMLLALHMRHPTYFKTLTPKLHHYFLACCWKVKHLIPQEHLRNGIIGAEMWIEGKIDDKELNRLDWYAEAECFALEYAESPEEIEEIQALISGIKELEGMTFLDAKELLIKAAYFADSSMVYSQIDSAPFVKSLCTSRFLCADLLREHITPDLS